MLGSREQGSTELRFWILSCGSPCPVGPTAAIAGHSGWLGNVIAWTPGAQEQLSKGCGELGCVDSLDVVFSQEDKDCGYQGGGGGKVPPRF